MKTIKKYVLRLFLHKFFTAFFAFMLFMTITHFFDYMHTFLEYRPSAMLLAEYFIHRLPDWAVTIMPIATLIGILFSLGSLNRHNEIIAIKSSGINLLYVLSPLISVSLAISVTASVLYSMVVPETNHRADQLYQIIKNKDIEKKADVRTDFTYMGRNRRLYFISKFKNDSLYGIKIIDFFPDSTKEKLMITARKAVFEKDNGWTFFDGNVRTFSEDNSGVVSFSDFEEKTITIPETPADFMTPELQPEEMNIVALKDHINNLRERGLPADREKVVFHHKISYPFANTVIMLIGIPLSLFRVMKNKTLSFFTSLLICFFYWGAISMGEAMGAGGYIPPFLGAWAANIIFLTLSIIQLKLSNTL
ncbi:MAG: LptF/LptG family permease [Elusimicrobia bacterium]|nr:LptF/LptG family permease [Elusimicrobiota bacterium]